MITQKKKKHVSNKLHTYLFDERHQCLFDWFHFYFKFYWIKWIVFGHNVQTTVHNTTFNRKAIFWCRWNRISLLYIYVIIYSIHVHSIYNLMKGKLKMIFICFRDGQHYVNIFTYNIYNAKYEAKYVSVLYI